MLSALRLMYPSHILLKAVKKSKHQTKARILVKKQNKKTKTFIESSRNRPVRTWWPLHLTSTLLRVPFYLCIGECYTILIHFTDQFLGPNRNKSVSSHDLLVQRQQEENDLIVQRSDLARSGKLLGRPSDPEQSDSSSKPILIASKQKSTTMSSGMVT